MFNTTAHRFEMSARWLLFGLVAMIACASHGSRAAAAVTLPDPVTFGVTVEVGDVKQVAEWLDAGLDPNFEGDIIGTGLMIAAWHGNIPMMELLVKRGADVNRMNGVKEQALMLAVWTSQREAAAWLLDHGAKINREGNEWSALHYAAFVGNADLAKFLLQKGADINAKSNNGSTVLMMAAHEGHEKVAEMLLTAGADRSIKNDWGEDALTWAMRYNNLTIAKMVTSAGEFAQVVGVPKETWGEAVSPVPAPAEMEYIIQQERLARASGRARVLSAEEYRAALERVANMKTETIVGKLPARMNITVKKNEPWRERATLELSE
jgi:uncharacterized protein